MAVEPGLKPAKIEAKRVSILAVFPQAKDVRVTGDFTKWSTEGVSLTRGTDGAWRGVFQVAPGRHEYRLLVDGAWTDHPQATERVANPFGTLNCVFRS